MAVSNHTAMRNVRASTAAFVIGALLFTASSVSAMCLGAQTFLAPGAGTALPENPRLFLFARGTPGGMPKVSAWTRAAPRQVVVPAHMSWFVGEAGATAADPVLELGYVNCFGNTLEWIGGHLDVGITALEIGRNGAAGLGVSASFGVPGTPASAAYQGRLRCSGGTRGALPCRRHDRMDFRMTVVPATR